MVGFLQHDKLQTMWNGAEILYYPVFVCRVSRKPLKNESVWLPSSQYLNPVSPTYEMVLTLNDNLGKNKLVPVNAMKEYGGVELQIHSFLISAPYEVMITFSQNVKWL